MDVAPGIGKYIYNPYIYSMLCTPGPVQGSATRVAVLGSSSTSLSRSLAANTAPHPTPHTSPYTSPYPTHHTQPAHPTPLHPPSRRFSSQRLACCSLALPSTHAHARARLPITQMAFDQGRALHHCACASTGPHMRGSHHTLACKARALCRRRSCARTDFAQRPSMPIKSSGAAHTPP